MIGQSFIPRQDIPEREKNLDWYKKHCDYAEQLLAARRDLVTRMSRNYDSYNGKSEADSIRHLVSTYGKKNRSKYISYRLSRTKLDILVGEFLKMPLHATIKTINSEAISEKMKKYEFALGAMHAKDSIEKLKDVAGVDVMEGAPIPDKNDPTAFSKLSFKDQNEAVMQIMVTEFVKDLSLLHKLSTNVQDCTITSRVYGRVVVNEMNGDMDYQVFDPRDAIVVEYDRDPFYEKTPVMGSIQKMPIHKILTTYKLNEIERNKLDAIRLSPNNYLGSEYRGRYSYNEGEFCADVIHMEWKSVRPKYSHTRDKTERELLLDDSSDKVTTAIPTDEYEKNPGNYSEGTVTTEWEEDLLECLRIGHDIEPVYHQRRCRFINRDEDTGKILGFSYNGMVFNKVDGDAISLKEICDNFDTIFDTVMYQLLKEINKAKGKVIIYDRAGLPKKTTVKQVLYNALNDSFIDYDSSAAGNMSGNNLSINQVFKEIDLGVSNSFQHLIALKNDIKRELDDITGLNSARDGSAPASSTVANNMQNLESSRTITEPMFYYITKFCEKVILNVVEKGKIVWGLYQPNKARMVLGDEKFGFLQATNKMAFASYLVELVNPRWEQNIMERMRQLAEVSLNAKELRPVDVLELELIETMADKKAMLKKAWEDIAKSRAEQAKLDNEAAAQANQQSLATQVQIARENREDAQSHDLDKIRLEAALKFGENTQKAKNDLILNEQDDAN